MNARRPVPRELYVLLALTLAALAFSAVDPKDRITWWLEVGPVLIGYPILAWTWSRLPLTPLTYHLIFVHALILILGAHYTYAEVPLGFWVQELFDLSRNHYDRLGHLAQGFIPAMLAREVFLRVVRIDRRGWLFFIVCCFCLGFSAFYELIEWWAALIMDADAEAFLATQGDPWDTQWDMFLALIGSITAQVLLGRLQDRQLEHMGAAGAT